MAVSSYFPEDLFSCAFADQTAYDAENVSPSWTNFTASRPEPQFNREIEDLNLSTPKDFVVRPRKVGSRSGTLSFSMPIEAQLSTYDPSSGNPVETPAIVLLKELIGTSHTGTYVSTGVDTGSTADNWKIASGTPDEGAAYLTTATPATAGSAIVASGWAQDFNTTPTPDELTMFEDARALPANTNDLVQTLTLYPDGGQPTPKTFRWKGINDDHDLRFIGCVPTSASITLNAGDEPMATFNYNFTDWYSPSGSGDGLLAATQYQRISPFLGQDDGRVWIGGLAASDGSAETTGTCGLANFQIEITAEQRQIKCHSAQQGVSNALVGRRTAKATFFVPYESAWVTANQITWDSYLEDGTGFSISAIVGDTVGQWFGLLIPNAKVSAQAQVGPNDGIIGFTVEAEPDDYTGDTGSTGPANSAFRISFG